MYKCCNEKMYKTNSYTENNERNLIIIILDTEGKAYILKDKEILKKKFELPFLHVLSYSYCKSLKKGNIGYRF